MLLSLWTIQRICSPGKVPGFWETLEIPRLVEHESLVIPFTFLWAFIIARMALDILVKKIWPHVKAHAQRRTGNWKKTFVWRSRHTCIKILALKRFCQWHVNCSPESVMKYHGDGFSVTVVRDFVALLSCWKVRNLKKKFNLYSFYDLSKICLVSTDRRISVVWRWQWTGEPGENPHECPNWWPNIISLADAGNRTHATLVRGESFSL